MLQYVASFPMDLQLTNLSRAEEGYKYIKIKSKTWIVCQLECFFLLNFNFYIHHTLTNKRFTIRYRSLHELTPSPSIKSLSQYQQNNYPPNGQQNDRNNDQAILFRKKNRKIGE